MARGGPEFELRVARRANLQQIVVAAIVQLETADDLRMAPVEALCQAQDSGERANRAPRPPLQRAEILVLPFRRRLTMVARDEGDGVDLLWLESPQMSILDQVVRVLVMPFVADVDAHVMQDRRIFQPFPLAVGQPVDGAGLVEQRDRQSRDLLSMLGPVIAPLREFEDASSPHVGIAVGLRDFLAVTRDVIEDETFAQ